MQARRNRYGHYGLDRSTFCSKKNKTKKMSVWGMRQCSTAIITSGKYEYMYARLICDVISNQPTNQPTLATVECTEMEVS